MSWSSLRLFAWDQKVRIMCKQKETPVGLFYVKVAKIV